VPGTGNPQAYNRYSYVLNNPIRYNDPTGHFCSDPEDLWSPGCDGSGGRPKNAPAPLPDSPVVINNPGPLDEGQEQDDPAPTLDNGQEQDDPTCETIVCLTLDWYNQNILAYQYTPIATSAIQYLTGTWMIWTAAAMLDPYLLEIAAPLYYLSFAENRAASFVGWQAVDYQHDHGLYDVSQTDVYVAGGSLFVGSLWPPMAPLVSDISFGWDIFHTNWKDFP